VSFESKSYPNGNLDDTVFIANASSTWQAISHDPELLKKDLYGGMETDIALEFGVMHGSLEPSPLDQYHRG
jgi:hypothetical protein